MNKLARSSAGLAAGLGLALLLPAAAFATARVASKSTCTSSGDFSITLGFDSSTSTPTATPSSNTTCVMGGNSVSFVASGLPTGMTWTVTFPSQTVGGSVFTNSCTFGSSQNSSCTVVASPGSGDYYYSVTETLNGTPYVLDPKVIISGIGRRRRKAHAKESGTAAQPPQQ
jgi:hypothetical protein